MRCRKTYNNIAFSLDSYSQTPDAAFGISGHSRERYKDDRVTRVGGARVTSRTEVEEKDLYRGEMTREEERMASRSDVVNVNDVN